MTVTQFLDIAWHPGSASDIISASCLMPVVAQLLDSFSDVTTPPCSPSDVTLPPCSATDLILSTSSKTSLPPCFAGYSTHSFGYFISPLVYTEGALLPQLSLLALRPPQASWGTLLLLLPSLLLLFPPWAPLGPSLQIWACLVSGFGLTSGPGHCVKILGSIRCRSLKGGGGSVTSALEGTSGLVLS